MATPLNRRMTALDAAFYYSENARNPMHIGGISIVDGAISPDDFAAMLDARLHLIPRYRQILVPAPLEAGLPTWEDSPAFDIRDHVVGLEIPTPGTETQLERLAAKLFEGMLDRTKPLWKIYVVRGLEGGRTALVFLVHHCMVDGVSGAELWKTIMDTTPEPAPVEAKPFAPAPLPAKRKLWGDAIWDSIADGVENLSAFQRGAISLARTVRGESAMAFARNFPKLAADLAKPVKKFPFNGRDFSGKRKMSWSRVPFAEVRAIRSVCGGTVNDVVLAALGAGIGRYLALHNVKTKGQNARIMVPVSVRTEDARGSMGNRVSMLPVDVPVGEMDPITRLHRIADRTKLLKDTRIAQYLQLGTHAWQAVPAWAQRLLGGAALHPAVQRLANPFILSPGLNMVCTNVPGPQIPLYCMGHPITAHYGMLPVVPGMGVAMSVFSYNQHISFSFIADANAAPDVRRLGRCYTEAFVALREAAGVPEMDIIEIAHKRKPAAESRPLAFIQSVDNGRNGAPVERHPDRPIAVNS